MQINIWSDIRCPFCFIGKKKFEAALQQFKHKDEVEIFWRSFELDPHLSVKKGSNYVEHFSEIKGISKEEALEMFSQVINMGKDVGIDFQLEKAVVANSFNAHRLIQYAKTEDLANEAVSHLFRAHFLEAKDIDDPNVLLRIGTSIGLSPEITEDVIKSDKFAERVRQDQHQAQHIGIRGVPFFVFNDKYAISGAQSTETFLGTLQESFSEYSSEKSLINTERK